MEDWNAKLLVWNLDAKLKRERYKQNTIINASVN